MIKLFSVYKGVIIDPIVLTLTALIITCLVTFDHYKVILHCDRIYFLIYFLQLKFVNKPRIKNLRFSGNGGKHKPKKHTHLKKPTKTFEPSLDMNPYMPIYYPPPPPVSPTGFPPPPPAAIPPSQMQGSREYLQPRSTEETFNRPTTHLLHTYPTWPSEEGQTGSYSEDPNAALYGNTPTSYNEFQNIPTKPSSSNTYSETPEQATGFPMGYFHPPVSSIIVL